MQKIYSQAFRVIGFVGKDYTHAGMCFNAIKALTSAWFEVRKSFGQDDSTSSTPGNIYGRVMNEASMGRIVEFPPVVQSFDGETRNVLDFARARNDSDQEQ
ncbi:hypothetical protein NW765_006450 [Fusarium oxysporum]|nr:hypothetical protein NW765_006450 [Fusarium oxysporum]